MSAENHPYLEQWMANAYGLTGAGGDVKNYDDLTTDEKLEAIGCHIFALPRSATIRDVMDEVKRSYGPYKILHNAKSVESIVELFLYHAVSEYNPSREAYLHNILRMESGAQEYLMQIIKDYVTMIEEEVKKSEVTDHAEEDDETKFCKYCAVKDQIIIEMRLKLADDFTPAYSFDIALRDDDSFSVSQRESEEKVSIYSAQIDSLKEELENSAKKFAEANIAIFDRENVIIQLEDDVTELQYQVDESRQATEKMSEQLRAAQDEVELLKPIAERVEIMETQFDRIKQKLVTFNEMRQQLRDEEVKNAETTAILLDCHNELKEFKRRCAQLEDYQGQCAEQGVCIEDLRLQLTDRDDSILRLKAEKMNIDREAKDTAFRLQLVEAEVIVLTDRLTMYENAVVGTSNPINEVNPMLMTELKKLRSENKELRERAMQTSAREFERLEKELADERQLVSNMRDRWLSTKESHDFLKQKLENVTIDPNHGGTDSNIQQYEMELIELRSKLMNAEAKIDTYRAEQRATTPVKSETNKKSEYLILELKTKLADAETKINELMDTNRLQETILNSSKEEGLIATRRAHEIEINGLKAALVEAQSRVNDLTVANKVQEAVFNSNIAEHNEGRKQLESDLNHLRSVIAELHSKVNELSVINKVQESALTSNKEEIANLKKQYEMETNHLKTIYGEAKSKIVELNEAVKTLAASKGSNAEEERARRMLEREIATLKGSLQTTQSKVNELLVANKVLESTLSVSKEDLIKIKDIAHHEISNLKDALSAAQTKLNELSVSNKVNENSSKLNESTVENLRNELADNKKYYDSELRKTKKALQDAQNKIHDLIHEQMTHETDAKPNSGDKELVSIVRGHFESEINQLRVSLTIAQEKINGLNVSNRVQDHALTAAKEELAIAKQQHDVDMSQAKFTLEVAQNKIRVLEDINNRQEETLKGLLDTRSDRSDEKAQAQDSSRSYFEEEIKRLKVSLADAQEKFDSLSLSAIEKDSKIRELTLENKIQENALNSTTEKFDDFRSQSDAETSSLKLQLSQAQSKLNEAAVTNKVQENFISNLKLDLTASKMQREEEVSALQSEVEEVKRTLEEAVQTNRRYEIELKSDYLEAEVSRLRKELSEEHKTLCELMVARSTSNDMQLSSGSNEIIVSGLPNSLQNSLEEDVQQLEAQLSDFQLENNRLKVSTAMNESALLNRAAEIESLKGKIIVLEKRHSEIVHDFKLKLDRANEVKSQNGKLLDQLRDEIIILRSNLTEEGKKRSEVESALELAKQELSLRNESPRTLDDGEKEDAADEDVLTLQSSLADAQNKVDQLTRELQNAEKSLVELGCDSEIQKNLLVNSQEQLSDLRNKSEAEISELKNKISASRETISELYVAVSVQEEKLKSFQSDILALQASKESNDALKKELNDVLIQNKVLQSQKDAALSDFSAAKTALEDEKQNNARAVDMMNKYIAGKAHASDTNVSSSVPKAAFDESQAKIHELTATVHFLEGKLELLQKELQAAKEISKGQINELQHSNSELMVACKFHEGIAKKTEKQMAEVKHKAEVDTINAKSAYLESLSTIQDLTAKQKILEAECVELKNANRSLVISKIPPLDTSFLSSRKSKDVAETTPPLDRKESAEPNETVMLSATLPIVLFRYPYILLR